jgi:hypothetical protein
MKKILLVSGCSFTTRNYQSHHHPEIDFTSYDKWPEMLAEKLNMQCANLAKSGAGNEYISNTIIDQIETMDKSKIGLVIPAWSQCRRRDYQVHYARSNKTVWRHELYDLFGDTRYWITKSLKTYYFFQIYCEHHKIPYKQVQMIELFKDNIEIKTKEKEEHDEFAKSQMYYSKLKNFVGETSGILSLQDVLTSNRKDKEKIKEFSISSEDSHPNKNGHRLLAEYIYENI